MKRSFLALSTVVFLTAACSTIPQPLREETAKRIAAPAWMVEHEISTPLMPLIAYERMHEYGEPVNLYIGGDGQATRLTPVQAEQQGPQDSPEFNPSLSRFDRGYVDPTPISPVALQLAAHDKADNVIYLSRPCQFTKAECDMSLWTGGQYSPRVMDAYNVALDNIKSRYGHGGFNLIGYDGGAAIAAILASKRDDILSLRTVAGNLDHDAQAVYLNQPLLENSLNAVDFAHDLTDIPQHHFIGGRDEIIRPVVLHSYLQEMPDTTCVQYTLVQEAEHETGWAEQWSTLLSTNMPTCDTTTLENVTVPEGYIETPEPIFTPRMLGDKK